MTQQLLHVPCPECGAAKGQRCTTDLVIAGRRQRKAMPHRRRWDAAMDALMESTEPEQPPPPPREPESLPPISRSTDPETSHAAEREINRSGRRVRQVDKILARLREGPATNAELAELSLKYTSRISDLRARSYVIECKRHGRGGITTYQLKWEPS